MYLVSTAKLDKTGWRLLGQKGSGVQEKHSGVPVVDLWASETWVGLSFSWTPQRISEQCSPPKTKWSVLFLWGRTLWSCKGSQKDTISFGVSRF